MLFCCTNVRGQHRNGDGVTIVESFNLLYGGLAENETHTCCFTNQTKELHNSPTVKIDFCAVDNFRACMGGAGLR